MLYTIKKNMECNAWEIVPNSGVFAGLRVATAEGIELSSIVVNGQRVIGTLQAVWGLQLEPDLDVLSDIETSRSLCLGRTFKGLADSPVELKPEGLYDTETGRLLKQAKRLVILGSSIFRRG